MFSDPKNKNIFLAKKVFEKIWQKAYFRIYLIKYIFIYLPLRMVIEQLSLNNIADVNKNYSKETTYNVSTAFWFNRNKDRKALAVDAGIKNYSWQASENLIILNMLLNKLKELKNQADNNVIEETQHANTNLQEEIINGGILPVVNCVAKRTTPQYMPTKDAIQLTTQDINPPTTNTWQIDITKKNNEQQETTLPTIIYTSKNTSKGVVRWYEQYPPEETSISSINNNHPGGLSFEQKISPSPIFKEESLLTKFMESAERTSLFDKENKNIFDFIITHYTLLSQNEDINEAINDEILTYVNDNKKSPKIKLREDLLSWIIVQRNPETGNLYFDIPVAHINPNKSDEGLKTARTIHLYADNIIIDEEIVTPQKMPPRPIEIIPNELFNTNGDIQSALTQEKEQVTNEYQFQKETILKLQTLEKTGNMPAVLTEDILMNYDLNSKNYPNEEFVNYPWTDIPYSDIYQYLYGKLKKEWEGKNITFTSPSDDEISWKIDFVGGPIHIDTLDGGSVTIIDINEVGPNYIIFLGPNKQNPEWPYVKYKLTKQPTDNNTIVAKIELLSQQEAKENNAKQPVVENNIPTTN